MLVYFFLNYKECRRVTLLLVLVWATMMRGEEVAENLVVYAKDFNPGYSTPNRDGRAWLS